MCVRFPRCVLYVDGRHSARCPPPRALGRARSPTPRSPTCGPLAFRIRDRAAPRRDRRSKRSLRREHSTGWIFHPFSFWVGPSSLVSRIAPPPLTRHHFCPRAHRQDHHTHATVAFCAVSELWGCRQAACDNGDAAGMSQESHNTL